MKKESGKKKWIIIAIVIIIILVLGIVGFFILNKTTKFSFGFAGFDFSSSSKALNSIGEAANKNTFESTKLNPFTNSTG